MPLFDIHNHLQDGRLDRDRTEIIRLLRENRVTLWGVNGTAESDWDTVGALAAEHPEIFPFFGLHPWFVREAGTSWEANLRRHLRAFPSAGIGEIGLDRWIDGYDLPAQERVFVTQLAIAAESDRPVAVHCLRAWGRLYEILRSETLPASGFLLHSYGGPMEMVKPLADLGAYFSLSGYFANPGKEKKAEVFRSVPPERLLLETDAPDMMPPAEFQCYPLLSGADGTPINHPANIVSVYSFAARLLGIDESELTGRIDQNARRFLRAAIS